MSTSNRFKPPYYFRWSDNLPHVAEADITGNGIGTYVAVVAIDGNNSDLYYIRLDHLDEIDLQRLVGIIRYTRDSARYALWDLLSQQYLRNGKNALDFFQQFVRVRTVSGHTDLQPGTISNRGASLHTLLGFNGSSYRGPAHAGQAAFAPDEIESEDEDMEFPTFETGAGATVNAYEQTAAPVAPAKRGPGRPPRAR